MRIQQSSSDRGIRCANVVAVLLIAIVSCSALSTIPQQPPSTPATTTTSRRSLLVGASSMAILPFCSHPPANAYGEFEPGAKARKKAAAANKSTTSSSSSKSGSSQAPANPTVQVDDLKGALGDFSYGGSSSSGGSKNKK